ncbi:MAG: dihydroneopterin aldolase, partial [Acetobacteraceae bacterium]
LHRQLHPDDDALRGRLLMRIDAEPGLEGEAAPASIGADDLRRVVDYERVVRAARAAAADGHTLLVETLAERIAAAALADPRVLRARVSVEKPDAFPDAATVGVVIERMRA